MRNRVQGPEIGANLEFIRLGLAPGKREENTMKSLNEVTLLGRLGAKPETRTTNANTLVANIRMATDSKWKDKTTSELCEATEWHTIVAWGRLAEICRGLLLPWKYLRALRE